MVYRILVSRRYDGVCVAEMIQKENEQTDHIAKETKHYESYDRFLRVVAPMALYRAWELTYPSFGSEIAQLEMWRPDKRQEANPWGLPSK